MMNIQGRFPNGCEPSVPFLFSDILLRELTGEMTIRTGKSTKRIFFENGSLIYCESDLFDERLGVVLNLTGKISDSQYDHISGLVHSNDRRIGHILVQNGIISATELDEAILYRIRRIAITSFSIVSGDLEFRENISPPTDAERVSIPAEEIIYSGGKRVESVNCISREFYFNAPLARTGADNWYRLLNDDERELMELIRNSDGISNSRLIARSGSAAGKYWEGISVLFLLGIIDFSTDKKDKPTEDDILSLIRLKKKLEDGDTDIFSLLEIDREESTPGIQRAYELLTRKFDPERFGPDISPELNRSAGFVLQGLTSVFRDSMGPERKADVELQEMIPELPDTGPEEIIDTEEVSPLTVIPEGQYNESRDKFEQGKELYLQNKFDEALIPLKESIRSGTPGYENFLYLGLCQTHLPFFSDEAERNLKRSLELAPGRSEPVHALGHLYLKLNRKKNAKKCFERAVELEPGNIKAAQDLFRLKYPPKKKRKGFFSK